MRIFQENAYIQLMKSRLNITVDNLLMEEVKAYASSKKTSVSELVENYFRKITRPTDRKTILDLIDRLEKPAIAPHADLKKEFYEAQLAKKNKA